MQIHRLTGIVFALLRGEKVSAGQLAEQFEVSRRTIYRDLDVLTLAGIPVYTDKGKGGGIAIAENYSLKSALLSDEEKSEILSMMKAYNAFSGRRETAELLGKLSAVFNTQSDFIEVDFSDWQSSGTVQKNFDTLRKCIAEKRVAEAVYFNSEGEEGTRLLEPLKLIFKYRNWYLYAYCRQRGENRLFKLSRFRGISVLNERFTRICTEKNVGRMLQWQGDTVDVTYRLSGRFKSRIMEYYCGECVAEENGDYILKLTTTMNSFMTGFFLSFGDTIEVLSPQWLKEELSAIHARAARL